MLKRTRRTRIFRLWIALPMLLVFVCGDLVLPWLHRLHLTEDAEQSRFHCCSVEAETCHYERDGEVKSFMPSDRHSSESDEHDSEACPICQLAKIPVIIPDLTIRIPVCPRLSRACISIAQQATYTSPRRLPFGRAPPPL